MPNKSSFGKIVASLVLSLGMVMSGYLIASSVRYIKDFERTVSVKGLDERDVDSDLAIWSLTLSGVGGEIEGTYQIMNSYQEKIMEFLKQRGFEESEVQLGQVSLQDKATYSERVGADARYVATNTVIVSSNKVEALEKASQESTILGKAGVVVTSSNLSYLFTKLNEVKPEMLKNATLNAREAAKAFAEDSGAKVGDIKSANQGYFSILNPTTEYSGSNDSSRQKKIRVVTQVSFFLK